MSALRFHLGYLACLRASASGMGSTAVAIDDLSLLPGDLRASTKQSLGIEGEGFASDMTWEEHTWKVLVTLKEHKF